MNEGDTQGEAPELPTGLYDGIIGKTDTAEDTQATEQENGGSETEEAKAETAPDTPKAEPTKDNWEDRYTSLHRKFGEQGNELGNLRKQIDELKAQLGKPQQQQDPFANDPTLKALDPTQKDLVLRGTNVALERLLQDRGLTLDDVVKTKERAERIEQQMTQDMLAREVGEIRKEFGEQAFVKYLPQLQQIAQTHPTLSPREAWDLATARDSRSAQSEKAKQLEAERKQRAASADFGKERPAKPMDGKLTSEALKKLSAVPQGRPSPRFAAILREVKREFGS